MYATEKKKKELIQGKNLGHQSSACPFQSLSQKLWFKDSCKTVLLVSPFTCVFNIFMLNHLNYQVEIKIREPEGKVA